jgi:hypothetical protein
MELSSIIDFDLGEISRFQGLHQEYLHELVNGAGGGVLAAGRPLLPYDRTFRARLSRPLCADFVEKLPHIPM